MQRVSTSLTLFFKFFIPVFWIALVGALTTAALTVSYSYIGSIPAGTFRIGIVLFFLTGVLMFGFTLMRLKRVEMDEHYIYVTNYFKAARYPYHNIDRIEERKFLFFKIISIYFKTPGIFGKSAFFLASLKLYSIFWNAHPELYEELVVRL